MLLTRDVDQRYVGLHSDTSAAFSIFARNHIEYGLFYTKLFCTWGETATPPSEPQRYLNHPPLLSAWVAISMLFFGEHEWAGRLVPIAATVGSAWILMVMLNRLQSPVLSLLSGFFYFMFPIVAFYGRMLCHEAPTQFFSLLMLHGYLQWIGLYGPRYRRSAGRTFYAIAVVAGIGTGWAAILMAGLIAIWQLWRTVRAVSRRPEWVLLVWTAILPAVALGAVVTHILWGCGWDLSMLPSLLNSRTSGGQFALLPWTKWFLRNWMLLRDNFSIFSAVAAVVYVVAVPLVLWRSSSDSSARQLARDPVVVVPVLLTGLHGLVWMLLFKRQSWIHEYWQFYLAPFMAVAMASVILAVYLTIANRAPRVAGWAAVLLILLPMPSFAISTDFCYRKYLDRWTLTPDDHVYMNKLDALEQLGYLVPPRVPVMTSSKYDEFSEKFGRYTNRWTVFQLTYYAHRPLIQCTDINEILANQKGCPAYLLELTGEPAINQLAQQLADKFNYRQVKGSHLFFDLRHPKR